MRFAAMLNRSLRLSYLFEAEIKQAKVVDFVDKFISSEKLLAIALTQHQVI